MNKSVKKKLSLVIPSLQAGGMERVMSELASYFSGINDLEIHLVIYGLNREIFYKVPESVIIHIPGFRFDKKKRFLHSIKTLFFLRKTLKKIQPDSILSFGELWNSFVLIATAGLKFPLYISDRCNPERKYSRIHTILRKILYPRATGIIAQTEKAKEVYSRNFKHKNIRVIGNPIRKVKINPEIRKENIILMVGRLIKTKHQDKLIELFLKTGMDNWKLVIVGYDHLQQNNSIHLKEIIKKNNAENKVFLEGKQDDVDSYYSRSRIFAFTSSSEGFPNAIGEAMSAGLPVIAFDCVAGPSEMIKDDSNGYLIPVFDYDLFRKKMELLMKNPDLQKNFGSHAKEDIKQFGISEIGAQFYQFLLSGHIKNKSI